MKRFPIPMLNDTMDRHGWLITGVPGGAIYTVGMIDKFKHPELMIHGLSAGRSDELLRSAVNLLFDGKRLDEPSRTYEKIVRNLAVMSIDVDPSNFPDWLGQAFEYHGVELKVVQLLWPDVTGRFPGYPGYHVEGTNQLRFDERRPEYDQIDVEHGHACARCGDPT